MNKVKATTAEIIKGYFVEKYPKREIVIRRFEESLEEPMTWDSFTNYNLYTFIENLRSVVSNNSAKTYAAQMKSFLNLHLPKCKGLSSGWEKLLSIREIESTHITLTEEEVAKIVKYATDSYNSESKRNVAATFAVCCITGARWEDAYTFKDCDLSGKTFKYMSKKTDVIAEIPVSPVLRMLAFDLRKIHITAYNKILKQVCKELNIKDEVSVFKGGVALRGPKWKYVSSHTARQSFATNLYNRGADLEIISKMMGHTTYQQTKRYINSDLELLDESIIGFFN